MRPSQAAVARGEQASLATTVAAAAVPSPAGGTEPAGAVLAQPGLLAGITICGVAKGEDAMDVTGGRQQMWRRAAVPRHIATQAAMPAHLCLPQCAAPCTACAGL